MGRDWLLELASLDQDLPHLQGMAKIQRLHINCDMLEPIREILSNKPRGTRTDLKQTQHVRRRGSQHKSNEQPGEKSKIMCIRDDAEKCGDSPDEED